MMKLIDLRSDTVTHPTPAMREAMYRAEVGDDVFGDDPTVQKLEQLAAKTFAKEAALFVASGSMGNLVSLLTHGQRGDQIIVGDTSHIFVYEQGGAAALGGIHSRPLRNLPDGRLDLVEIEAAILPDDQHFPRTRLICLENTSNGRVLRPDYISKVAGIAERHGLKMHLDGARIFNASVALNVPVSKLSESFDSVQFCLSKGLSCPVGSMICGSAEFIKQARRNRKLVGGGMRQAGILAAAGIVALEQMIERLAEDHSTARLLAQGLAEFSELEIDLENVETNMVFFTVSKPGLSAGNLVNMLKAQGVLVCAMSPTRIRAVTHYGIENADIKLALEGVGKALASCVSVVP